MPLLSPPDYRPPFYMINGHVQTILPSTLRKAPAVNYTRERIETPDQDFLDLDWSCIGSSTLVILSHGLEGDTHRPYIKGMVYALNKAGWDTVAWNYRSCSGEPNRLLRSYHMGVMEDLDLVVQHSLSKEQYKTILLVGFSMGGNLTLNYLGQWASKVPQQVKGAAVFSVPCHMHSACVQLAKPQNRVYMKRFLRTLQRKLEAKSTKFTVDLKDYHLIKTFAEFDDKYTAPIHGFKNAADYYERCSSVHHLHKIKVPTLLVNALNDPFLSPECFPVEQARANPHFFLEIPKHGGHVGFSENFTQGEYYSEKRAVEFLQKYA